MLFHFISVGMYRESYCTTYGFSVGVDGCVSNSIMLKFFAVKFFFVMGKALSGELSCTLGVLKCQKLLRR